MLQTIEAEAFLNRIASLPSGPGVLLDNALQPSLDDEAELRRLFAMDKENSRIQNPYVGLVDIFEAPAPIRATRARVVKDEDDLSAKHILPLSEAQRRKEGEPCMVPDLDEFRKNWSVFTEGSLMALPLGDKGWANVVAAGGSVLACLTPLPDAAKVSKRAMRKWYHNEKYPTSDVDLFLYGLTPEQAEVRINEIYEAVRDSVPWDVTCIRTKHTVSIHSQYLYRSVQIVLRLYKSPAEVLAGFDIDAPCVAYDGRTVWASPRAIVAMMRQANTVDMTRRSPSYEVRLAKYASRGYEVFVPSLCRADIDPTIFERAVARITGLARLLVLEKLTSPDARTAFLESRRALRGRPNPLQHRYRRSKRKYKGDLKTDISIIGLEMNDYDVASLHIPYGPGWDARRIDKLVYQTDLGMNSTFNPKNKGRRLHRHPAFFGTMKECLEDCCEQCPKPVDEDEIQLQQGEDEIYIRGRISFIEEDPGRQNMTGSFNPIDVGEWSEQAFIGPTERFFAAIAAGDRTLVQKLIQEQEKLDAQEAQVQSKLQDQDPAKQKPTNKSTYVNRRDHVGRTPLHLALISGQKQIACDLIDAGARMTARLVDGRTALHVAAQYDTLVVIKKLLVKSKENEDEAKKKGLLREGEDVDMKQADTDGEKADLVRASSEDDWSSDDDDGDVDMSEPDEGEDDEGANEDDDEENDESDRDKPLTQKIQPIEVDSSPDPEEDELDILDVNIPDWDLAFTPLQYAVMFASLPVVEALLAAGADPKLATKANCYDAPAFQPLTLTILRDDDPEYGAMIAGRLLLAGASSSAADDEMRTIFHWAVCANQIKLVERLLQCDPNAKAVIEFPAITYNAMIFPIVSAICNAHYAMLAVLLAYGAKLTYTEEEVGKFRQSAGNRKHHYYYRPNSLISQVHMPLETSLVWHDDVAQLLVTFGAQYNIWVKFAASYDNSADNKLSIIDWIRFALRFLNLEIEQLQDKKSENEEEVSGLSAWQLYLKNYERTNKERERKRNQKQEAGDAKTMKTLTEIKGYFVEIEQFLTAEGAKTGDQLVPTTVSATVSPEPLTMDSISRAEKYFKTITSRQTTYTPNTTNSKEPQPKYVRMSKGYGRNYVLQHETALYDQLFDACFTGDNDKIEQLCLPPKGSKTKLEPLQISAAMVNPLNTWEIHGYTPLFAATAGRQWKTARLVMAIASAQYKPEEEEEEYSTHDIKLDSDDESECSDDSDITIDQKAFSFVDIANRPSVVECDIHPKRLLHETTFTWNSEKRDIMPVVYNGTLLRKAVDDDDFEAFVNIANLYKASLPEPMELNQIVMEDIIICDQPEMLDEFIRRTGFGINVTTVSKDQADEHHAINDKSRIYLGLNVHGKKRSDLAKKNDPNASDYDSHDVTPLVWQAASMGAQKVVEYLATDKPLTAYRFYASSNSNERALRLRRIATLEKDLPDWLGWKIGLTGESPLTAAILSKKLNVVKVLLKKSPHLMSASLKERVKFTGFNPLLLAVYVQCDAAFIDYLLANGVPATETDLERGWNVFHYMSFSGQYDLLEHLLHKLPKDVSESLLAQQSKNRLNNPLHLAVSCGHLRAVQLISNFTREGLLIRNIDGLTPLHSAVHKGYSQVAKILVDITPKEAYHMENGVGETPLESALAQEVIWRTRQHFPQFVKHIGELPSANISRNKPFDPTVKGPKIKELRLTLNSLVQNGKLAPMSKLAKELISFADKMEAKLAAVPVEQSTESETSSDGKVQYSQDACNRKETLRIVKDAVAAHPFPRQLVHLIDVQKSIQGDLRRGRENFKERLYEYKDELEPEEDAEVKERRQSLVLRRVTIGPDVW